MGFELVHENGRSNPRAFCDHCKQVILGSGNVEWEYDCQGEPHRHTVKLFHKPCSQLVGTERRAKGLTKTLWMPLDHFLVYLSNGLDLDSEESKKNAEAIATAF